MAMELTRGLSREEKLALIEEENEIYLLKCRNELRDDIDRWWSGLGRSFRYVSFENLKKHDQTLRAIEKAEAFIKDAVVSGFVNCEHPTLLLTGGQGTGKSALSRATLVRGLEYVCRVSRSSEFDYWHLGNFEFFPQMDFINFEQLVFDLTAMFGGGDGPPKRRLPESSDIKLTGKPVRAESEGEFINYVVNELSLLVLDDIARQPATDFRNRLLYGIIDRRLAKGRPTIITMNYRPDEAMERGLLDGPIASRMVQDAVHIHLRGPDLRTCPRDRVLGTKPLDLGWEKDPAPHRDSVYASVDATSCDGFIDYHAEMARIYREYHRKKS